MTAYGCGREVGLHPGCRNAKGLDSSERTATQPVTRGLLVIPEYPTLHDYVSGYFFSPGFG